MPFSRQRDGQPSRGTVLERRFMLSMAVVILALMGPAIVIVQYRAAEHFQTSARARGMSMARSIAAVATPALLSYNYMGLGEAARGAARDEGIAYVIIHDKEGLISGDSRAIDNEARQSADEVSAQAVRSTKPLVQRVEAAGLDGEQLEVLDVSVPVYVAESREKWGTVRVGVSLEPVRKAVARITYSLTALGAIGFLLCLLGARAASRRITRPLQTLRDGTLALAQGDLTHRINIKTGDEIEDLARHFNNMADEIESRQADAREARAALERLNASLEEEVKLRTSAQMRSESKYRTLVEGSPVGIAIIQKGRIVYVNPAYRQLVGDETRSILDVLHAEDREKFLKDIQTWNRVEPFGPMEVRLQAQTQDAMEIHPRAQTQDAMEIHPRAQTQDAMEIHPQAQTQDAMEIHPRAQNLDAMERRLKPQKQDLRYAELRWMPLDLDGERAELCMLVDVSAFRRLQEQVAVSDKLRALGELASGVAHDFNNCLAIILGRCQLLARRTTDETILKGLRVIEKAASDGGHTVRRIQDFARMREGAPKATYDLAELVNDVVEITRGKWKDEAEGRGVKIAVQTSFNHQSVVTGNPAELREALTNLILNAIDAMPQGGQIRFTTRDDRQGDAPCVRLEVSDTGVGIPEEIQAKIFDPFFSTKGNLGTGLGLAITYGIVTRQGGTIAVESRVGAGTTFTLKLPTGLAGSGSGRDRTDQEMPFIPATILVVDDEPEILEVLVEALGSTGYKVTAAAGGHEALVKLDLVNYDLVLTDLGMPGITGWDVVAAARSRRPDILVGLVTGWGETLDAARVEKNGISLVVSKPFEMDQFLIEIQAVLARRHREAA